MEVRFLLRVEFLMTRCGVKLFSLSLLLTGAIVLSGCSSAIKGFRDFRYAQDGWNMFRNDPAGYQDVTSTIRPPVSLIWGLKLKGRLYATPIVNGSLGVLPALDRRIYLFDPETGAKRGRIKARSSSSSSPAVAENLLYIASENGDGRLRCLNINSGKVVWVQDLSDVSAPIVLHGRALLIGNYAGEFYCFNRYTGDINWSYRTGGPIIGGAAAANGKVIVGSSDGYLRCFNFEDGELIWEFAADEAILSTPAIGEYCYVTSTDKRIYAIDIITGNEAWRFETGGQIFSSPVLDDEAVYFGSNDGCLYSISSYDGHLLWKFRTDAIVNGTPLVLSDAVVFGSGDSHVYFLDKHSGDEFYRFRTKSAIVSSPVYSRGRIYMACSDRWLYCFGSKAAEAAINADIAPE
jgi:outer membrane protein assembly factor BamB